MAKLTRRLLEGYDARLAELEGAAHEYVSSRVAAFIGSFPAATPAQVREYAIEKVTEAVDAFGDGASSLAADLYDNMAQAAGAKVAPALIDTSDVSGYIDGEVRYQLRKHLDGDSAGFSEACGNGARDQVSRRANQTIRANAERDGLYYARVPMGGETCTFCAMLASRGFVYKSAKAAGEGNHYHANCRCKVVPDFGVGVEGYDPGEWYERWQRFEEIDADGTMTEKEKQAAKAALADNGMAKVQTALQNKGVSEEHAERIARIVSDCPDEDAKAAFLDAVQDLSFDSIATKDGSAWYSPSSHGLTLNMENTAAGFEYRGDKAPFQTFFHEFGHFLDHRATGYGFEIVGRYQVGKTASSESGLGKAVEDEVKELLNAIKKERKCSMYYAKLLLEQEVRGIPKNRLGGLADIINGATSGTCCWGHQKSYWKRKDGGLNNLSTETFAHFYETTMANPEALETLKSYLPKTYTVFKSTVGGGK